MGVAVGAFFSGLTGAAATGAAVGAFAAGKAVATFFTKTILGQLLSTVALSALRAAMVDRPTSRVAGIRTSQTLTGGTNPASFIIGDGYASDGQLVAPPMSHGSAPGVPNAYLNYVIELGDIPGQTLAGLILEGEPAELGTTPHPDFGIPILGRFTDHAWIKYYDGTQTQADPMLVDRYSDYERPWGADRIGASICYAILTFKFNREIFGAFPRVRFVMVGIPLYDPRKDSSVGGVGSHRWGDRSTWEPSPNNAVQIYNILRGITLPSGRVWGGEARAEDLPLDNWWAAMNACDVQIALEGGGTENQYRSAFEIFVNDEPAVVIEELLKACGGRIAELGGLYKMRVGGTGLPVWFMTDEDIVVSDAQSFKPFPAANSTYNAVHASYPDPEAVWQSREAPARYNLAYEVADGGQRSVADLRLPAAPYNNQVQRLMLSYLENERRFRTHSFTLPPDFGAIEPLDAVSYSSVRNGYIDKVFEVISSVDPLVTGNPTASLREDDPADYDWQPDFTLPTAAGSSVTFVADVLSVPGWAVDAVPLLDGDGVERRERIRIRWLASMTEPRGIRWQVRVHGTQHIVTQGSSTRMSDGEAFITEGVLRNQSYEVRGELIIDVPTTWTAWTPVATGNTGLTVADIGDQIWAAIDNNARQTAQSLDEQFRIDVVQPIADLIPPIADDIDRIDADIADIQVDIPQVFSDIERINTDIERVDIRQRTTDESLNQVNESVLFALSKLSATESLVRGAGIYVDPDDGTVRIAAFDGLQTDIDARFSEVEISLDAQSAAINLTATRTWVNQQLAQATLDPSFQPLIDDLELQVATAEVNIDALEAQVSAKADVVTVNGLDVRLATAEANVDALEEAIQLRVETTVFTALETRVSTAEVQLGTLDAPAITQTVADVRYLQDASANADVSNLADLIQGYRDREARKQDISYVQQDMRALITEDREAIASLEFSLGAQIDANRALIRSETITRTNEFEAFAQDLEILRADTEDASASLAELNEVSAESGSPNARALHQVQLDTAQAAEDADLLAQAVSAIETRVEETEHGQQAQSRRFDGLVASTNDDAEADMTSLRAVIDILNTRRENREAVAVAAQDLRALVLEDRLAIASLETFLAAAIEANAASIKAEQVARAAADEVQAQDTVTLRGELVAAQSDIVANAEATGGLLVRITDVETTTTTVLQDITTLFGQVEDANAEIIANASATGGLQVRMTNAEGQIASQATDITTLQTDLISAGGDIVANASATGGLAVRVTDVESQVASQAEDITELQVDMATAQGDIIGNATATVGLVVRVTDAEGALSNLSADVTTLQTEMITAQGDILANASATGGLASEVATIQGVLTAQATDIVTLTSGLSAAQAGIAANTTATGGLATRVTDVEDITISQSQDITTLLADMTTVQGDIIANASATGGLLVRISDAEGVIASQAQDITTLQQNVQTVETGVASNATATGGLAIRVTDAETQLTTLAQETTSLNADMTGAQGAIAANASATDGLTIRVTNAEGAIASQATDIVTLTSNQGANTAQIQTVSTTVGGVMAERTLRIDNNGVVSGVVVRSDLDNQGVPTTAAVYQVDKFSIIAPGEPVGSEVSPFAFFTSPQVIDGVLYPAGLYARNAIIGTAQVGTLQIGENQVVLPARVTRPGVVTMTSTADWEILASIAMNRRGFSTDLVFSGTLDGFGSGVLEFGFFRDGTLLNKRHHSTAELGRQTQFAATFTDFDAGTGSTVYQIKGRRAPPSVTGGWNANVRVFNRHLAAHQFQR